MKKAGFNVRRLLITWMRTRLLTDKHACAATQVLGNDAHPICPVLLGDARLASKMAEEMLAHNIYVIGFSFPVVPKGEVHLTANMSGGWVLMAHQLTLLRCAGPHQGAAFGHPHARADRQGHRRLHRRGQEAQRHRLMYCFAANNSNRKRMIFISFYL
jgi:hypothetical protein